MKLQHRNVEGGGASARGWGRTASGALLLSPTPHFPPQLALPTSNLALEFANLHVSTLVLKPWTMDRLWQNPWESATGAEAAGHVGRSRTEGRGPLCSPGDPRRQSWKRRGLECSGGEKKFGESDLTFQSHTLTPKLRLSDPWLKTAGRVPHCASAYSTVTWRTIKAVSSQRRWEDWAVYNLCNEFTTHSSDVLIITIANIYCLVLFQGFHELSLQHSERKWKCWWLIGIWLFATLCTAACPGPLSVGFSKQEYWSRLPCPPPGDLPSPRIKPGSPAVQADLYLLTPGKPILWDNHFCRWHCADKENEALKAESTCLIKIYRASDGAGILWPPDLRAWTLNHRDILPNLSQIDVSYYCFYDRLLSKR